MVNLGENYLQRLVEEGGETSQRDEHLRSGHGPVVVRVREPLSKLIQIRVAVGSALPIASAQGTIFTWRIGISDAATVRIRLLDHLAPAQRAELLRARLNPFASTRSRSAPQVVDGIHATLLAVPVFDHETVAATLGFVGTTAGIPADPNSGLVAALREAAARLSRELGLCAQRH